MLNRHRKVLLSLAVPLLGLCATLGPASAENIAVGNYGSSANGMPFAVALAKGYFQQEGANVTGIIASQGGGTSVRNAMAGVAYGEANPGAIAVAIQQGADIKIVSDNVLTIAEFAWMVKKDSPIKTLKDLKGKKIGYTNPRSTSQALAVLLLEKAGYKEKDAELVKTGGFGPMLAALDLDQIDVAAVTEPLWSKVKDKYRVLVTGAEALPPLDNVVGMATGEAIRTRGDFIRGVIKARRRAVEFMIANPDEAGDIVAKPFNITPEVARSAVRNLTTSLHAGHSLLGQRPDPPRGHEADHRSAEERRRPRRRGRSHEDDRHAIPARRHQDAEVTAAPVTGTPAAHVALHGIVKRFPASAGGQAVHALGPIDLGIRKGEFFAVVGPSGCGKSTLLEIIAGLVPATEGRVEFEEQPVEADVPEGIGVVFQEDACFPWLSVRDNVAFGLRKAPLDEAEKNRRVVDAIAMMGLGEFAGSYPAQLSGGMRQRVCIARTLVTKPRLLLLDEPFGALDQQTRLLMGDEVLRLWREIGATVFLITHALDEAAMLADRIAVMSARPGTVIDVVETHWPRERDSRIVERESFGAVTSRLWKTLREESMKTMGRTGVAR